MVASLGVGQGARDMVQSHDQLHDVILTVCTVYICSKLATVLSRCSNTYRWKDTQLPQRVDSHNKQDKLFNNLFEEKSCSWVDGGSTLGKNFPS